MDSSYNLQKKRFCFKNVQATYTLMRNIQRKFLSLWYFDT